ncbi:hypothetical protein [Pendulispora albinea]|uniref:Bacterial transcriptional activator domain-containing protein n=1 Tax=Pendulispora albinea TaxID=2741071 RepID=A0ABZ2LWC9_9BACT
MQLSDEYAMALVSGDFDNALHLVRQWNEAVRTSNNGRFRGIPLLQLIELLRELGHAEEARSIAGTALREHRAWTADETFDGDIEFARLAYITGSIDTKKYRELRDAWIRVSDRSPVETWLSGFAGLSGVGAEMAPPIAPGEYAQDWIEMSAETFSRASAELIRVGRTQDAVQHADAAAQCCLAFDPMEYVHGQVAAALAHDAAGDTAAACTRYTSLRELFAKFPKSASFRLATRRLKDLSCMPSAR